MGSERRRILHCKNGPVAVVFTIPVSEGMEGRKRGTLILALEGNKEGIGCRGLIRAPRRGTNLRQDIRMV